MCALVCEVCVLCSRERACGCCLLLAPPPPVATSKHSLSLRAKTPSPARLHSLTAASPPDHHCPHTSASREQTEETPRAHERKRARDSTPFVCFLRHPRPPASNPHRNPHNPTPSQRARTRSARTRRPARSPSITRRESKEEQEQEELPPAPLLRARAPCRRARPLSLSPLGDQ